MDSKGDFLAGAIIGALVGFGAGVLMAPASGEEMRDKIRMKTGEVARDARDRSGEMLGQAVTTAEDMASRARESAREALMRIRERAGDAPMVAGALDQIEDELDADEILS